MAVVTGASSGIGRWIALGLARAGWRTVLVVRDAARGEAARRWIAARVPGAATELVLADLSLLAQARAAAARIASEQPRIGILVNNAGVFSQRRQVTTEGHELILAVNHLAPFVLTRGLLEPLRGGAPARIVNIGSAASDNARLDLEDLEGARNWNGLRAYGQSKLALMMATFAWAERLGGSAITANVVHPGVVATNIARVPGLIGVVWTLGMPFMLRPAKGADTPLHVALAPELAGVTGQYFKRRRSAEPNPLARDQALIERLWTETERLAGPA
ncbi:MAG: SDR family oxidoreductase [Alphaproteobacteria bacterium]|nr:SDR family oxidoreductase [Alphaproteobacteria bacterium]